jgi:uncharacterized membrane protein HdeD (DUF308 family)
MITDDIKSAYNRSKWALVLRGLYGLVIGVFILARPMESVAVFALVIALWALLDGIADIVRAFTLRGLAPHWWVLLLTGAVSVLFGGAALYYYPGLSLSFAVVWTSLWLVTAGAMSIYVALMERRVGVPWGWTMTLGVLTILAGALAYTYPGITLAGLLGVIAAFGIIGGVVRLMAAGRLRTVEREIRRTVGAPARA